MSLYSPQDVDVNFMMKNFFHPGNILYDLHLLPYLKEHRMHKYYQVLRNFSLQQILDFNIKDLHRLGFTQGAAGRMMKMIILLRANPYLFLVSRLRLDVVHLRKLDQYVCSFVEEAQASQSRDSDNTVSCISTPSLPLTPTWSPYSFNYPPSGYFADNKCIFLHPANQWSPSPGSFGQNIYPTAFISPVNPCPPPSTWFVTAHPSAATAAATVSLLGSSHGGLFVDKPSSCATSSPNLPTIQMPMLLVNPPYLDVSQRLLLQPYQ